MPGWSDAERRGVVVEADAIVADAEAKLGWLDVLQTLHNSLAVEAE